MHDDARGLSRRPHDKNERLGSRGAAHWIVLGLALGALLLGGFVLLRNPDTVQRSVEGPDTPTARRDGRPVGEVLEEIEEDTEEVHHQEIVAEEPVLKDEEISDHVETDNDLPNEESFGKSEGLSDAPFEGPANNGTIGIGASAGSPFRRPGRGGGRARGAGRDLGTGGGARAVEERVHRARPPFHTEGYDRIRDNAFRRASEQDVSTFSIDVDTASYANVRRHLLVNRRLPPKDAVRIEELLNYFTYEYAPPPAQSKTPFDAHVQVAACPWNAKHRLARIAIKGRVISQEKRPAANLVFLLDVSGSMSGPDKLPLLQKALAALTRRLEARDRVSIVVYAGRAGMVLPPTSGDEKSTILAALERLRSGGSTNGGAGIQLAYSLAAQHFIEGGVNRVILATDGDFNVGVSDRGDLTRLIERKAKTGVFLSVLGFGSGNLKDDLMEDLSNKGNGNYAYIDSMKEAHKVLVEQASGTLVTIAKDVKVQIFFNPARVAGYRLIGYENRMLAKQDFNDDKKDAGEIGAGHAVTALYELVPVGQVVPGPKSDENPFVRSKDAPVAASPNALFRLRLRYKQPDGEVSTLLEEDVYDDGRNLGRADRDFQWAAAVASFGMLLRDSEHKGSSTFDAVLEMARPALGSDVSGYRREFLEMVSRAKRLAASEGE